MHERVETDANDWDQMASNFLRSTLVSDFSEATDHRKQHARYKDDYTSDTFTSGGLNMTVIAVMRPGA